MRYCVQLKLETLMREVDMSTSSTWCISNCRRVCSNCCLHVETIAVSVKLIVRCQYKYIYQINVSLIPAGVPDPSWQSLPS